MLLQREMTARRQQSTRQLSTTYWVLRLPQINDTRSSFSNYGQNLVWVAAPGEGIVTLYPYGTYAAAWGTSFSAPFVSGAAALLLDKRGSLNYSIAASAIAHAKPISPELGQGRLDIYLAAQAVQ